MDQRQRSMLTEAANAKEDSKNEEDGRRSQKAAKHLPPILRKTGKPERLALNSCSRTRVRERGTRKAAGVGKGCSG